MSARYLGLMIGGQQALADACLLLKLRHADRPDEPGSATTAETAALGAISGPRSSNQMSSADPCLHISPNNARQWVPRESCWHRRPAAVQRSTR